MAAYVQTGSQSHAEEVAARIEAGMVYLNGASEDPEAPFWRLQNVGNGREWGGIPFGEFLETKAVIGAA
jgi:aldehyde dehydrogenase (NAD+)